MDNPAISVIVPVYGVEPYVERCARSLFGQTLDSIEFIFIDDCSPDASMDLIARVLEDYPGRKPFVKCFRMQRNSGQAAVRMKGLELAAGEYIAWCDGDDEMAPDAFRALYEKAQEGSFDIVTCNILKEESPGRWRTIRGAFSSVSEILSGKAPCNLVNRIIRRNLLQDNITAPAGNMGEDMMLTVQATLRCGSSAHVDEPFYRYYFREDSTSKAPGAEAAIARTEALAANIRLILDQLSERYGYTLREPEIVAFKYDGRHCLNPFVHERRCFRMWKSLWPEVDGVFLFTPGIPLEKKFWFVLIHLHLYRPVKRITSRLFR